ncbi:unnamed protein product [Paramecium sonneborni]|uniref:Uncharacterized protein n=1 Tax=Paramecium sonneborni TaxID=65129 RepID=A0A8S1Q2Y6_9CILI|nr:unnamed protein product [Paramecium sonneborni]
MLKPQYIYNHEGQHLNIFSFGRAICKFKSIFLQTKKLFNKLPHQLQYMIHKIQYLIKKNRSKTFSLVHNNNFIYTMEIFVNWISRLRINLIISTNLQFHSQIGQQCK